MIRPRPVLIGAAAFLGLGALAAAELQVVGVEPAPRSLRAPRNGAIVIDFDRPVRTSSVVAQRTFWAFGRWSGTVTGTISFSRGRRRMTLRPDRVFSGGENVSVFLSHDIRAVDGSFLRPGGYSFQFWTMARRAPMRFVEVQRMTPRFTPSVLARAYGGVASDLDGDRFLDLAIVNEDTGELAVFLNRADRSGAFHPPLPPVPGIGRFPSPSEPSDFDRDGIVDIAVVGLSGVAVLLGHGDGTFAVTQIVDIGGLGRGVAVLDADGDGDVDVAATSHTGRKLALLVNDGAGFFAPPVFFEGSGPGEYALAAADMNEDGMLDLIVGDRLATRIFVHGGHGDATFDELEARAAGGAVWMLVPGDVNGDGHEDVVTVNSESDTSGVLLGDGTGQLRAPRRYPAPVFPLATDLGDLDGDGDLDWLVSRFGGGWSLLENDGRGRFSPRQSWAATQAGSCALLFDIDNDRDLDLALVDELEDEIIVLKNDPSGPEPG